MVSTNSPVSTIFLFPVVGFLTASTKIVSEGLSCGRVLPNCLLFYLFSAHRQAFGLRLVKAQFGRGYEHFYTSSVLSQVSPFFLISLFLFLLVKIISIKLSFSNSFKFNLRRQELSPSFQCNLWRIYFCAIAKFCNVFS